MNLIPKHLSNAKPDVVIQYLLRQLDRVSQKNKNRKKALKQSRIAIDRLQLENARLRANNALVFNQLVDMTVEEEECLAPNQ